MVVVSLLILLGELMLFLVVNSAPVKKVTETLQNIKINDKSKEFVNLLKDDLRRNNDDYLDTLSRDAKNTSKPYLNTKIIITTTVKKITNVEKYMSKKHESFKNNLIDDTNRRALDESQDNDDTKTTDFTKETTRSFPTRFTKVTKSLHSKRWTKKHTKLNAKKLDKVKSYLEKNKVMFKDFVSHKKMETLTQAVKTTNKTVFRMRAQDTIEDHTLPNDEQLDMAPAKGGRIHAMRIKDRLCQRNVLMPEGPKYDSKGNVYLKAFSSKLGHDYAKTVPPKIILPKCCNCCKKSVLGCE